MNSDKSFSEKWHLDKRVSIGHLGTTIFIVVTFMLWAMNLDTSVTINEHGITDNDKSIERLDNVVHTQYKEIIRRLEVLDRRFDSVIQRTVGKD